MEVLLSGLVVFARSVLALVFVVAAVGKLRDRAAFVASVRELRVAPAAPVAAAVVAAELLVVLLLVPGRPAATAAGLALAAGLLLAFTAAVVSALRRGLAAGCRCFGASTASPYGRRHVARNLALAVVAVAGAAAAPADPAVTGPVVLAAVPLAALAALVVTRLDDLVALVAAPAY
jgi:hypothetical protein